MLKKGSRPRAHRDRAHPWRRAMAAVLAVCMALTLLPTSALGAEAENCGHIHDQACGYIPASEGTPCGHVDHDASCGYVPASEEVPCDKGCTGTDGAGNPVHMEGCAYVPATQGAPCGHERGIHDGSCGYAQAGAGAPCLHEHDERCGGAVKTADDAYTPDGGPVSVRGALTAPTPTPEVETYSEAIYANGAALVIEAGTTTDHTNIFVDTDDDQTKDDGEKWLKIGDSEPTEAGYDLSRYTIYGGRKRNALTGDTSITMTGGKVNHIYGGGDGNVTGSTSVVMTGGDVGELHGGGKDGTVTGDTSVAVSGGKVSTLCGGGGQGNVTGCASVSVSGTAAVNYLYGGSYGSYESGSVGSTRVTVSGGKVSRDLYGGGKGSVTGCASVTVSGGEVATVYGGGNESTTGSTQVTLSGGQGRNVHGGGRYDTVTGTANVSMTGGVFSSIYGGGLGKTVGGAATVAVTGGEITRSVYGGGEEGTNNVPPTVGAGSTVTVGGAVQIGTGSDDSAGVIINGGTKNITNGVASFAISPALADGALVKINLPAGYDLSGSPQVVTGAAEGDMSHLTLSGEGGAGKELVLDGTVVKVCPPAPTIPTATPEFYEGASIQCASDDTAPISVGFSVQNSYAQGTVYQLYTSADGSEHPQGITAQSNQYRGYEFTVTGIKARAELWVSATEPGKLESGRVKIIVLPNFPGAEYSNLYLKTAQELADYLNYCEPDSATVSGDTVTMSRDVMTLHYLYFGRTSTGEPAKDFPYQGTLDMNGHALRKGPELGGSYVFFLRNADSSLTLRDGKLYDTVFFEGTLLLEDCRLQGMSSCLRGGGRVELTGTTAEIVNKGQSVDPDFEAAATCAVWIREGGSLTIHTGTLKNAFAAGCTYVGTQPLAACIAQGSVSVPANSSAYDGPSSGWRGMQACRETVTVTVFDPDAYWPINGGVTVDASKNIFANGNAVTIVAGTEAGKTNLYYTKDPKRALISLPEMGAADGAGYDLKEYAVWGGGRDMALESTSLTMTGGEVKELYGGGWACGVSGTAAVTMTGGKAKAVSAGGSSTGGDAEVYTVKKATVEISGGAAVNSLSGSGGNGAKTPIGICDVTVTGEAEITTVSFGNAAQPTLTVGGNVRIMALVLNTEGAEYGVDSFAIDPGLGAGAAIGLLFYAPLTAGRVVATGAAAGDLGRISVYPDVESAFGPHRIYLDGTSIKCEPLPTYAVGGTVTESGGGNVNGATVKLMRGKTKIAAKTTGADGKYNFTNVPAGAYNVVVTKDGKTVTRLITVTNADLTGQNLTMPSENKNSVIEVKDDTPAVVVGGLDKIAEDTTLDTGTSSVTVKLTVEAKAENAAANAGDIKALAGNKTVGDFLDLSLNKVVEGTGGGTTSITDTGANILEIVVPYDFTGKKDVAVYRYHGSAEALKQADTEADGTFRLDAANGLIHIYAAKFSTYAIAYTPADGGDPTPPTPSPTPSPSGGGDDDSDPAYKANVAVSEGGSASVTPTRAHSGDRVTITPAPDAGYVVDRVTVTGPNGKTITVRSHGDGTWSFTQPDGKVTVTVTFKAESKSEPFPFTDVAENDWFYESVRYVYDKGLMRGNSATTFGPGVNTDRGMIVTILWRLEGAPDAGAAAPFPDVDGGAYYADAVAWAAEHGIVKGYSGGGYGPNDPVTREQLAVILYGYARFKGLETPTGGMATGNYADGAQVSAWARDAMGWALAQGIVSGKDGGRLDPKGCATRAETAAMLMRFLEQ